MPENALVALARANCRGFGQGVDQQLTVLPTALSLRCRSLPYWLRCNPKAQSVPSLQQQCSLLSRNATAAAADS